MADKKKLICFDVDGTLTKNKSGFYSLTVGLGCPVEEVISAYERTKKGEISIAEGEGIVTKIYCESGKASQDNIFGIFDAMPLKRDAPNLFKHLKETGYLIYLVSGGIDMYVEMVAKKTGADGFFHNASLEFKKNGNLKRICYQGNEGPTKVKQIGLLADKVGIDIGKIVFVGDSENDYEAFCATKHGIAVHPFDEKLDAVAWKKIKILSEIKEILQN